MELGGAPGLCWLVGLVAGGEDSFWEVGAFGGIGLLEGEIECLF